MYVTYYGRLGRIVGRGEIDRGSIEWVEVEKPLLRRGYGRAILRDLVRRGARRLTTVSVAMYHLVRSEPGWRYVGSVGPISEGWGETDSVWEYIGASRDPQRRRTLPRGFRARS